MYRHCSRPWRHSAGAREGLAALHLILALAYVCGACGDEASEPSDARSPTLPPSLVVQAELSFINPGGDLLVMASGGAPATTITEGGGVGQVDWTEDGSMVAVEVEAGGVSSVQVIRRDGSPVFERQDASLGRWSGDGSRLAVVRGQDVEVVDSTGNDVTSISSAGAPAWSPNGARLAVMRISEGVGIPVLVDSATGEEMPLSPDIEPDDPSYAIAWHPAGMVIGYRDVLYDLSTGVQRQVSGTAVSWSPDGRMLMVELPEPAADGATVFRLLDAAQDFVEVIGLTLPEGAGVPGRAVIDNWTTWSADGRYLVYMDPTPGRERARVYDTVEVGQRFLDGVRGGQPDISGDTSYIAYADAGTVRIVGFNGSAPQIVVAQGARPQWLPAGE